MPAYMIVIILQSIIYSIKLNYFAIQYESFVTNSLVIYFKHSLLNINLEYYSVKIIESILSSKSSFKI